MITENFCWKVCTIGKTGAEESFFSVSAWRHAVEYKLGEITKPKIDGTPLFAFRNFQYAAHFYDLKLSGRIVFKCIYGSEIESSRMISFDKICTLDEFKVAEAWKLFRSSKEVISGFECVDIFSGDGMILVNWIRPIEIVYRS